MKSFCIGVLLGTVVLFMWGWIAWMKLPIHQDTLTALPNETEVRSFLIRQQLADGVYPIPAHLNLHPDAAKLTAEEIKARNDEIKTREKSGPIISIVLRNGPGSTLSGKTYTNGFLLNFIAVLIAAVLLKCSLHSCRWYIQRVIFVALLGVFVALMADANMWNWMAYPVQYTRDMMMDHVLGWILVGLVLGAFIKPRKPKTDEG